MSDSTVPAVASADEVNQIARDWVANHLDYPTVAYRMPWPIVLELIEANYPGGMLAFLLEHPVQP